MAQAAFEGSRALPAAVAAAVPEQLTSRDAAIRRLAIEGIVRAGDTKAIANIETATAGESIGRRSSRARSRRGARRSRARHDRHARERRMLFEQAMGYLVELGQGIAAPLSMHLKDPNARVRERIAQVLGLIGGKDAQVALEGTLRDPDVNVSRAAERGLARIRIIEASRQPAATR